MFKAKCDPETFLTKGPDSKEVIQILYLWRLAAGFQEPTQIFKRRNVMVASQFPPPTSC